MPGLRGRNDDVVVSEGCRAAFTCRRYLWRAEVTAKVGDRCLNAVSDAAAGTLDNPGAATLGFAGIGSDRTGRSGALGVSMQEKADVLIARTGAESAAMRTLYRHSATWKSQRAGSAR